MLWYRWLNKTMYNKGVSLKHSWHKQSCRRETTRCTEDSKKFPQLYQWECSGYEWRNQPQTCYSYKRGLYWVVWLWNTGYSLAPGMAGSRSWMMLLGSISSVYWLCMPRLHASNRRDGYPNSHLPSRLTSWGKVILLHLAGHIPDPISIAKRNATVPHSTTWNRAGKVPHQNSGQLLTREGRWASELSEEKLWPPWSSICTTTGHGLAVPSRNCYFVWNLKKI